MITKELEDIKNGEVIWTQAPMFGQNPKERPCLVLWKIKEEQQGIRLMLAGVTSKNRYETSGNKNLRIPTSFSGTQQSFVNILHTFSPSSGFEYRTKDEFVSKSVYEKSLEHLQLITRNQQSYRSRDLKLHRGALITGRGVLTKDHIRGIIVGSDIVENICEDTVLISEIDSQPFDPNRIHDVKSLAQDASCVRKVYMYPKKKASVIGELCHSEMQQVQIGIDTTIAEQQYLARTCLSN